MAKPKAKAKVILLDIGNTAVSFGVYHGGRLHQAGYVLHNDIPKKCLIWSKSGVFDYIEFVISSVVPLLTHKIINTLKRAPKVRIWVAGRNLKVPVPHRYKQPKRLGIDRLVNLYGALRMYQGPLLVMDYGTAITADYLSGKGVFEGGMIIPGPEISFQALLNRAALIPKKLRLPHSSKSFLGRSTYACIESGILEGFGAMTDELIRRFRRRYGKNLRVLATGGFTRHLKPFVKEWDIVDERLSLKSLLVLFKNREK